MVASAKVHNRAERACSLEKKRPDNRNDFVRRFFMERQFTLGQSILDVTPFGVAICNSALATSERN
jgi:hypothetical protein